MQNKIGVVAANYNRFGLEVAFKSIKEIGFDYIEIVYAEKFVENLIKKPEEMTEQDINEIIELCSNYEIEVYALTVFFYLMSENSVSRFKKVLDVAASLGTNIVVTDTGKIGIDEDTKKEKFYKEILEIGDYAKTKKITVCFEIHGNWYSNGKQGAEIIRNINHQNIRLNYDTGNVIFFNGGRPEEDIVHAIPYMSFMHLKDKVGGPGVYNFPALGDGEIDFKKIFYLIKDYEGPLSIEIELPGEKHTLVEINEAHKKSYDFLKENGIL